jgi:hypothetical protein
MATSKTKSAGVQSAAATAEAPVPQQVVVLPAPGQPAPVQVSDEQKNWIELEKERAEAIAEMPGSDPFAALHEAGVMFYNSPQTNDQWIGGPLDPEDPRLQGVALGTIRKVPIGPEALQPGRKVIWPEGTESTIAGFVTGPEGVTNPATGQSLVEAYGKKSKK